MRMKCINAIIFVIAVFLLLSACGSKSVNSNSVSLQQANKETASIYKSKCINCHGTDLSGKIGEKTNIQMVHERRTYEEIVQRIEEGGDTMPPYKDVLTENEIDLLAKWLSKQS